MHCNVTVCSSPHKNNSQSDLPLNKHNSVKPVLVSNSDQGVELNEGSAFAENKKWDFCLYTQCLIDLRRVL